MTEPAKLNTDSVILRNIKNDTIKRTIRIYAERKMKDNPFTYEIKEEWQEINQTPKTQETR